MGEVVALGVRVRVGVRVDVGVDDWCVWPSPAEEAVRLQQRRHEALDGARVPPELGHRAVSRMRRLVRRQLRPRVSPLVVRGRGGVAKRTHGHTTVRVCRNVASVARAIAHRGGHGGASAEVDTAAHAQVVWCARVARMVERCRVHRQQVSSGMI
eukprot:1831182-Pleurochrysis_carterae.AAC.1